MCNSCLCNRCRACSDLVEVVLALVGPSTWGISYVHESWHPLMMLRMIATNLNKLRGLLNELKDHEVVSVRNTADGGQLYQLKYDTRTLKNLAQGRLPDAASGDEANEGDEDVLAQIQSCREGVGTEKKRLPRA